MFSPLLKGTLRAQRCSRSKTPPVHVYLPKTHMGHHRGQADHKAGRLHILFPALLVAIFTWPPWRNTWPITSDQWRTDVLSTKDLFL